MEPDINVTEVKRTLRKKSTIPPVHSFYMNL